MIDHPAFTVEPWCLRATSLDLDVLGEGESLFALANGHLGWRGNLDEGEPHGLPGAYLNGVCELRPLPYAEAGYGYPESGQTVINVTNGKVIRLLVEDEAFDVRYGELRAHEQCLDFRAGTLQRQADWVSPTGRAVRVTSTRLVSFTQRATAAISYEVTPLEEATRVVIQSELVANEELPPSSGDPRVAAALRVPLLAKFHNSEGHRVALAHATERSGARLVVAMDHVIDGPAAMQVEAESQPNLGRMTVSARLEPGQRLRLIKFVGHAWSGGRSFPALRDRADAALTEAVRTGWDGLLAEQRSYLDAFWARADVEVEGDAEIQQAVRFSLFHLLQAGARIEGRAIPAKGLTGPGYDGHSFWDTEAFVLPVLTHVAPDAAADALRWRHTTLPMAVERARQLGLRGAAFPWRTITGEECSSYWPAGTAAFHVNAAVADAVLHYLGSTADPGHFEQTIGLELLVETARLWRSLGHYDRGGRFRIDGVTGPDEYSAIADNNIYTNLMAQQNLLGAADAALRQPDRSRELGIGLDEAASWREAAKAMYIPFDTSLGVHPQSDGFTSHQVWDFATTSEDQYPLFLHFPYFDLYRKQVVKQADLVLAMHRRGDAFSPEEKARNFAYYERITVRDSSLSACSQSVVAAEVGHLDLAYAYLNEAAFMDLQDLEHNTRDGLHIASLAGTWIALVEGLAGMRDREATLRFAPRLPDGLTGLRFKVPRQQSWLGVTVDATTATYTLLSGSPLAVSHHGEDFTVTADGPVVRPIPARRAPVGRPHPTTRAAARTPPQGLALGFVVGIGVGVGVWVGVVGVGVGVVRVGVAV